MPDPIANVINRMLGAPCIFTKRGSSLIYLLDHIHVMDQRQMKMCEALGRIGELLPEDDRERIKLEVCRTLLLLAVSVVQSLMITYFLTDFAPLADDKKLNEDESQEQ